MSSTLHDIWADVASMKGVVQSDAFPFYVESDGLTEMLVVGYDQPSGRFILAQEYLITHNTLYNDEDMIYGTGSWFILIDPCDGSSSNNTHSAGCFCHKCMQMTPEARQLLDALDKTNTKDKTHPCTCPRENFSLNGSGCTCGGI